MAHFAKLNQDNVVIGVTVVNNDVITLDGIESEQMGIDFLTQLTGHSHWKQTSYNNNIRKNYAGVGFTYDSTLDAFIPPKPYPSWILRDNLLEWIAPVPYPSDGLDGKMYVWDESTISWVEVPT